MFEICVIALLVVAVALLVRIDRRLSAPADDGVTQEDLAKLRTLAEKLKRIDNPSQGD